VKVPLSILLLIASVPASAQVEKVAMRTTGISCGICAGLSEIYFRRMPGVDGVKISLSKEAIMLTYKPGATFDPAAIRDLLRPMEVGVVQFQIGARGQALLQGGKRMFVAGKQAFLLLDAIDSPDLPLNKPVQVEGILSDGKSPMELKVLSVKPLK
jgi:hypothetical protein